MRQPSCTLFKVRPGRRHVITCWTSRVKQNWQSIHRVVAQVVNEQAELAVIVIVQYALDFTAGNGLVAGVVQEQQAAEILFDNIVAHIVLNTSLIAFFVNFVLKRMAESHGSGIRGKF